MFELLFHQVIALTDQSLCLLAMLDCSDLGVLSSGAIMFIVHSICGRLHTRQTFVQRSLHYNFVPTHSQLELT